MRILNLNPNPGFADSQLWQKHTTPIAELDPSWHTKSLLARTISLSKIARGFDVILFHFDSHLAGLASLIQRAVAPSRCLVFQGLLRDVSRYSPTIPQQFRNWIGLRFHRWLVRNLDTVIVHSSAEVDFYSAFFKTPKSRFKFIPYFYYEDAAGCISAAGQRPIAANGSAKVLAIGRHRDYECFMRALAGTIWQGRIVAGASDRLGIVGKAPENVQAYFEISREEYRSQIAQSDIVVLPLHADRWQRSLGQIAMFEAIVMRKPVIAAETFHLADYASENEVLYYRPGDAEHLREQIERLIDDSELRTRMVQSAWDRIHAEFTKERYIARLINACQVASDSKSAELGVESLHSETAN